MPENVDEKLYPRGLVGPRTPASQSKLHALFGLPPFSVWNTREGWWQERRRLWLKLGIKSEVGRGEALTFNIPLKLRDGTTARHIDAQTSIFDPTLTEVIYRFFCPPGGIVLDPFAGGSVRGIVASVLGLRYWGCDLSKEQIEANKAQLTEENTGRYRPKWHIGDSSVELEYAPEQVDFLFSCPPYGNLEVYSKHPADISNKSYDEFHRQYAAIVRQAAAKLRRDRFACFVVGNYRSRDTGWLHDLVGDTVRIFQSCGLAFYNEIILVNSVGTGGMRTNGSFVRGHRKIVKMHQNVLVFVKGLASQAAEACKRKDEQLRGES